MSIIAQKEIPLTKGKFAIVDGADYEWLSQWKWHVSSNGYAIRGTLKTNGSRTTIRMHVQIIGSKPGLETDHLNGDRLDNRRSNLRYATRSQNMANQKKTRGTSQFKGVGFHKRERVWQAAITINGKCYRIGRFSTETEAALAYNKVAISLFGEFARLNVA